MTTLAAGTSTTISLAVGQSLFFSPGGNGLAVLSGGQKAGEQYKIGPSPVEIGPFSQVQAVSVSAVAPVGYFILPIDASSDLPARPVTVDAAGTVSDPRIQAMVSGGGNGASATPAQAFAAPFFGGEYTVIDAGTSTITMATGPNGNPALKFVIPAGTSCEVGFPAINGTYFGGEAYLSCHGNRANGIEQVAMFVTPDADYSIKFKLGVCISDLIHAGNAHEHGGTMTRRIGTEVWGQGTGTPAAAAFTVGTHKIRVNATAGGPGTFYLYAVGFATPRKKARICVITDDGYDDWFRLGQPIMDARGIKVTAAIIPLLVDRDSATARKHQLRRLIDAGGAVVAHGPNIGDGNGNLFTTLPDTASRVANMSGVRDWITANGLATPNFGACYVWPQGLSMQAYGDLALLDASITAGFTFGRNAGLTSTGMQPTVEALSAYQRLTVPMVGHTWGGSTATEATNIAAVVARIQAAGANKVDAPLMLHRVQLTTTADGAMSSIGIRVSDLTTIADAIKAEIDAGRMESVTMPEMAASRLGNPWAIK